jgi:hypothetical protein
VVTNYDNGNGSEVKKENITMVVGDLVWRK